MERIYYSRQNYNQLKRKQYEEHMKRQNRYYLYMRKQYEQYRKRQNRHYLYRIKQYEEYIKRQNRYYLYRRKYYEEFIKIQNRYYLNREKYREEFYKRKYDKTNGTKSKFFNNIKKIESENNNINNHIKESNTNSFLEANFEERNLEYNKYEVEKYKNLENNIYNYIEDSHNEKLIVANHKEDIQENKEFLEENDKEYISENDEKYIEERHKEDKEDMEEDIKFLEEGNKECLSENDEEYIEESDKEDIEEDTKLLEKSNKEYLGRNNEELLEDNNTYIKEELSKKSNISTESLYIKLPVILAETNITISIEDTITLAQEVNRINRIKMKVFLTKSNLIPYSSSIIDSNSGLLFVTGFIRKFIEYETKTYDEVEISKAYGDTRQCSVEVPFNFTTRISFLRPPIFIKNTISSELEFLGESSKEYGNYEDIVIGHDSYEKSFMFTEVFNEKPFVELLKANFIEVDINKSIVLSHDTTTDQACTKIKEEIILNLILRVLQKQQLRLEIE